MLHPVCIHKAVDHYFSPTDLQADVDYEPRERRGTIKYEEVRKVFDKFERLTISCPVSSA